ncbi:hypothetical protein [Actinoplanes sp. N902-109]|uniref:hypothetical protein n=1 Tax=Actinoplanes sp. (strain N902-109) TaxID=649831 RepID=UPI000687F93F|nr:hypothetical protein [Actinoplanes sp. N902-109]
MEVLLFPHILIRYEARRWELPIGREITIGRGSGCDIRLPQDDHLSRHAATVRVLEDCLLITNESRVKPFVLRAPVGEDRLVEPGAATGSKPWQRFALVFAGEGGSPVRVEIDATALPQPEPPGEDARARVTVSAPLVLTNAQRRVLAALCEPLLTRSGPAAAPATYSQIGARLGRQPQYIRNVVKSIREQLSGHGIPDLIADADGGPEDFRWTLSRWAVRSHWITPADLAELAVNAAHEG